MPPTSFGDKMAFRFETANERWKWFNWKQADWKDEPEPEWDWASELNNAQQDSSPVEISSREELASIVDNSENWELIAPDDNSMMVFKDIIADKVFFGVKFDKTAPFIIHEGDWSPMFLSWSPESGMYDLSFLMPSERNVGYIDFDTAVKSENIDEVINFLWSSKLTYDSESRHSDGL